MRADLVDGAILTGPPPISEKIPPVVNREFCAMYGRREFRDIHASFGLDPITPYFEYGVENNLSVHSFLCFSFLNDIAI